MPYNIPGGNTAPFGFMPYSAGYGELISPTPYIVTTSEGQIFPGDVMTLSSIQNGALPMARLLGSAGGTLPILGIAQHGMAAGLGSSSNTITSTTLVLIYDSPDQLFYAVDSTSGLIGSTGQMKNVQFSATVAGSTAANRSGMFIAGNTASSNLAFPFKLMGIHPVESVVGGPSSAGAATGATTDVRRWIVKPLNHTYGQQGIILLTT